MPNGLIVYATDSGMVRRIVLSDEMIDPQVHIAEGESALEFDPVKGSDVYTAAALIKEATGFKDTMPKPCAVVDKDNEVVQVIMADPALDSAKGYTLVESYDSKVAVGDTYDPTTKSFTKPEETIPAGTVLKDGTVLQEDVKIGGEVIGKPTEIKK